MVLVDDFLRNPRMQEERVRRFGEFVQREKLKGSLGLPKACLQNDALGDYYGPVHFGHGMHKHLWKFYDSENPRAVIYDNEEEAIGYSKQLLGQLRMFGYFDSKVWVEQVALCFLMGHPFSAMVQPTEMIESGKRYIIRMNVR